MARVKTIPLFTNDKTQQQSSGTGYQKKLAEMLMSDQPKRVWSTGEGLLSAGSTIMGALLAKRAEDKESQDEENAWSELSKVMTGASGLGTAPSPFGSSSSETSSPNPLSSSGSVTSGGRSGGASRSAALNERKQRALTRLVEKGYSEHAAQGIVDNLADESSLDPRQVGDNGTAFGLAQHRKERFAALKKFASERGKPFHDFDTNLDFIDHELRNGPDEGAKIAFAKLQASGDADTAYDAFLEHYERPSRENLAKRRRGGRNYAQAGAASQEPGGPDLTMWQGQARQGAQLMQSRNPVLRRHGLNLLMQAQEAIAGAQTSYSTKRAEQQRELQLRREMQDREDTRMEEQIRLNAIRDGDRITAEANARRHNMRPGGQLVDNDGNVMYSAPQSDNAGTSITYDEQGRPVVQIGGTNAGRINEQQGKDIGFFNRGSDAEIDLREREDALLDWRSKNLGAVPYVGNYMKSPEFRQAEVPARNFLAAILRKDTGAAVTPQEFELYGSMFLPVPGDDQETMRLKRKARAVALRSIQAGLGTARALADAHPDLFDGKNLEPKGKREETGQKPHPEARRGTDGKWYRPDPARPGKYLVLE